jgi:putative FmdB family regulatory protein
MPIYEYQCEQCGRRSEALQRFDDAPLTVCEECGGPLRKLLSAPAFQFKGSGWYITDYAKSGDKGGGEKASDKTDATAKTGSDTSGTAAASSAKGTESSASSGGAGTGSGGSGGSGGAGGSSGSGASSSGPAGAPSGTSSGTS